MGDQHEQVLMEASQIVGDICAQIDYSCEQTDKILLLADVILRGALIGSNPENLIDGRNIIVDQESCIKSIDAIQVELAQRANELTAE